MSLIRKITVALLVVGALFSGNARKLLNLAANAVESTALAGEPHDHSGATCN